jgi:lipocalin
VVFDSDDASPFPAPYWILELGPVNSDGLYDYGIVSDNLGSTLFVLARDVDTYNSKYKASVSVTLTKLGFTGYKAPIDLYQGSDCVYESTLRRSKIQTLKKVAATQHDVPTVTTLDVGAYMGLWFTTYIDEWVASTTFRNAYCSTAKYTAQEDGTFAVHNAATKDSTTGEIQSIDGYAFIPDATEPGKLTLHLDGVPHDGTYWVAATGPIVNGQYAYSIVTDSTGVSLYVLARDVEQFAKLYDATVQAQLKALGFVGPLLGPVPVVQDATCVYDTIAAQK